MNEMKVLDIEQHIGEGFSLSISKFNLQSSDCALVVGPNGAGKSSFLKLLSGLSLPDKGSISLFIDGVEKKRAAWKNHLSFLPETFHLPPKDKVIDSLIYFLKLSGLTSKSARQQLHDSFERWNLSATLNAKASELSLGTQRQVKVALVMMKPADLIILDEPFRSVDEKGIVNIGKQIHERAKAGAIVVVALLDSEKSSQLSFSSTLRFKGGHGTKA